MPVAALLLALAAAVVHAGWNLILSGERDTHSAFAVATAAGTVVFAPIAALTWRLHSAAVGYAVVSSTLELMYLVLLASAYSLAAMGFVYPIARGSAPVLVLIIGAVFLAAHVSAMAAVGVVLVAAGIVLVRGVRAAAGGRELALALGVGVCIAGFTLVDKRGVAHAAPFAYLEFVFGLTSLAYVAAVWRRRGTAALRAAVGIRPVLAGIGFFGAYGLALTALQLASAASVAAVRESSVLIATVVLAAGRREVVSGARMAGAACVVAGIALISLA
jgi:drug/metabolite transporter (DMT)-like permease